MPGTLSFGASGAAGGATGGATGGFAGGAAGGATGGFAGRFAGGAGGLAPAKPTAITATNSAMKYFIFNFNESIPSVH